MYKIHPTCLRKSSKAAEPWISEKCLYQLVWSVMYPYSHLVLMQHHYNLCSRPPPPPPKLPVITAKLAFLFLPPREDCWLWQWGSTGVLNNQQTNNTQNPSIVTSLQNLIIRAQSKSICSYHWMWLDDKWALFILEFSFAASQRERKN